MNLIGNRAYEYRVESGCFDHADIEPKHISRTDIGRGLNQDNCSSFLDKIH